MSITVSCSAVSLFQSILVYKANYVFNIQILLRRTHWPVPHMKSRHELIKQYGCWLAGPTHSPSEHLVTCGLVQDAYWWDICGISWVVFYLSKFSHVLLRCPYPILNREWQGTDRFGQYFIHCVFLEERKKTGKLLCESEAFDLKWRLDWIRLHQLSVAVLSLCHSHLRVQLFPLRDSGFCPKQKDKRISG